MAELKIPELMQKLKGMNKLEVDDAPLYSEEYGIPQEYVSEMIVLEKQRRFMKNKNREYQIEKELAEIRLEQLRLRCDNYVKKASKSASVSISKLKEESKRADDAEKELSDKTRQLDKVLNVLRTRDGGISEIELFFSSKNGSSKKFRSVILKAIHPDKHQGLDDDIMKGLSDFFRIINQMVS